MTLLVREGTIPSDGISRFTNLRIVDLIDSMLVVDPERRFTIEQFLAHAWLTQAAPGQDEPAKSTPLLRRKPTMLGSSQVVPSSEYIASSKELRGPEPGHFPIDPMVSTSDTKGKGKVSSVDLDHTNHVIVCGRLICIEILRSDDLRRRIRVSLCIRTFMVNLDAAPKIQS